MTRGHCETCGRPLIGPPFGPIVMDRDGYRHHFECWRDRADAEDPKATAPKTGARRRRKTDHTPTRRRAR